MTEVFTWAPQEEAAGKATYRRAEARYGDGYVARAGDGINNKQQAWQLSFKGNETRMTEIIDFLDDHAGYRSFFWTPSLGVQGYYVAGDYELTDRGANRYVLRVTFEQAFYA